jgi:DNA-directed RNA polymerase subunit M/transcription elongation factor TFIIS
LRRCPYCAAVLIYDRMEKLYLCRSCGATMSLQDLVEHQERIRLEREKAQRERKKKDEYLEWWLSSKR